MRRAARWPFQIGLKEYGAIWDGFVSESRCKGVPYEQYRASLAKRGRLRE
jgi:hypothetical protein